MIQNIHLWNKCLKIAFHFIVKEVMTCEIKKILLYVSQLLFMASIVPNKIYKN